MRNILADPLHAEKDWPCGAVAAPRWFVAWLMLRRHSASTLG